jgi:hypothetical protein
MSRGDWITQFDLDHKMDSGLFELAFLKHFPGGRMEFITDKIVPGHTRYHLHIPTSRRDELFPWLEKYAQEHNADHKTKRATEYPFNPDC